jgi:hypothetical protein
MKASPRVLQVTPGKRFLQIMTFPRGLSLKYSCQQPLFPDICQADTFQRVETYKARVVRRKYDRKCLIFRSGFSRAVDVTRRTKTRKRRSDPTPAKLLFQHLGTYIPRLAVCPTISGIALSSGGIPVLTVGRRPYRLLLQAKHWAWRDFRTSSGTGMYDSVVHAERSC